MKKLLSISQKILFGGGGWFPLFVFFTHLFVSRVIHLYDVLPSTDVPMHFLGGLSIAFFVSQAFQLLPRSNVNRTRVLLLELLLVGSLTASAAVFWEFAEFIADQLFSSNIQVSLANTIKDMAMGVLGAAVYIFIRSRRLHVGIYEIQNLISDWFRGYIVESNQETYQSLMDAT